MDTFNAIMATLGDVMWHDYALFVLLGTGILYTVWSGFSQYRALTHGPAVLTGRYDDRDEKGALSHFQALSAVLSATVGLGNIAGVALAVALGGPGAIFWMWVVGIVGMGIKLTEVVLSMLYRNMDDPDNPHGGPMWVVSRAMADWKPGLAWLGKLIGGLFCVTLLISTTTGGNMFQAFNVAEITNSQFGIPTVVTGLILAFLVGLVIIGGVKRIGAVAANLVPFMVIIYLISGFIVLGMHFVDIPGLLRMIVVHAFTPHEAVNAFIGGSIGMAVLIGMQRAFFSSEAGQGSAPIAYAAAKTREPVREGLVGAMGPFIDTIVVCTITALVILATGIWDRDAEAQFDEPPGFVLVTAQDEAPQWTLESTRLPERKLVEAGWRGDEDIFMVVEGDLHERRGNNRHRITGQIEERDGELWIGWRNQIPSAAPPEHVDGGLYVSYPGATLTALAFDSAIPGYGFWMVLVAVWLFALSTMITWSYYGEQGVVFLFGERAVMAYRFIFCGLIVVATLGLIRTDEELNNFTAFGTGAMLWVNVPILLILGWKAMKAYKEYVGRLRSGQIRKSDNPPKFTEIMLGKRLD
jgi:AGCS family alanine or glycine:cation symporter